MLWVVVEAEKGRAWHAVAFARNGMEMARTRVFVTEKEVMRVIATFRAGARDARIRLHMAELSGAFTGSYAEAAEDLERQYQERLNEELHREAAGRDLADGG